MVRGDNRFFALRHVRSKNNEYIYADSLKITGGDASIASLELNKSDNTLVLIAKKEGYTDWRIEYNYMGMSLSPVKIGVKVYNTTPEASSVKIISPNPSLRIGEKLTYSAEVTPLDVLNYWSMTWTSSDPSVAKVVSQNSDLRAANIEGLRPGTSVIKASCAGKYDSFTVTVKANYEVRYKGSTLPASLSYRLGSAGQNLLPFSFYNLYTKAIVNPIDAEITDVQSSNPGVAQIHQYNGDTMYVKVSANGKTTLTFKVGNQVIGSTVLTVTR